MATTSPDNIWTPDAGDDYALTTDLATTADTIQAALTSIRGQNGMRFGVLAGRPTSGVAGRFYSASNTGVIYYDDGSAWRFFYQPWQAWSPTLSGFTLGNGSLTTRYLRTLGHVHFSIQLTIGSTTNVTGAIGFSAPVSSSNATYMTMGSGSWMRSALPTTPYPLMPKMSASSNIINAVLFNSSAAVVSLSQLSSTYPAAPATGDVLYMQGSYEVAS